MDDKEKEEIFDNMDDKEKEEIFDDFNNNVISEYHKNSFKRIFKEVVEKEYGNLKYISIDQWKEIMREFRSIFFLIAEYQEIYQLTFNCPELMVEINKNKLKGIIKKDFRTVGDLRNEMTDRGREIFNRW